MAFMTLILLHNGCPLNASDGYRSARRVARMRPVVQSDTLSQVQQPPL